MFIYQAFLWLHFKEKLGKWYTKTKLTSCCCACEHRQGAFPTKPRCTVSVSLRTSPFAQIHSSLSPVAVADRPSAGLNGSNKHIFKKCWKVALKQTPLILFSSTPRHPHGQKLTAEHTDSTVPVKQHPSPRTAPTEYMLQTESKVRLL